MEMPAPSERQNSCPLIFQPPSKWVPLSLSPTLTIKSEGHPKNRILCAWFWLCVRHGLYRWECQAHSRAQDAREDLISCVLQTQRCQMRQHFAVAGGGGIFRGWAPACLLFLSWELLWKLIQVNCFRGRAAESVLVKNRKQFERIIKTTKTRQMFRFLIYSRRKTKFTNNLLIRTSFLDVKKKPKTPFSIQESKQEIPQTFSNLWKFNSVTENILRQKQERPMCPETRVWRVVFLPQRSDPITEASKSVILKGLASS